MAARSGPALDLDEKAEPPEPERVKPRRRSFRTVARMVAAFGPAAIKSGDVKVGSGRRRTTVERSNSRQLGPQGGYGSSMLSRSLPARQQGGYGSSPWTGPSTGQPLQSAYGSPGDSAMTAKVHSLEANMKAYGATVQDLSERVGAMDGKLDRLISMLEASSAARAPQSPVPEPGLSNV